MSLTPQITLTASFTDLTGTALGSSTAPCRMRIDLCGYGQTVPVVAGTSVLAQTEMEITSTNGSFSFKLWGNDVITPSNTFYQITVMDSQSRVIQSGIYQFTGTSTIDLSSAAQITNPSFSPPLTREVGFEYQATSAVSSFNLPSTPAAGTVVKLWWQGIFQGFSNGRNFSVSGATVNLQFTLQSGEYVDVLYYQS